MVEQATPLPDFAQSGESLEQSSIAREPIRLQAQQLAVGHGQRIVAQGIDLDLGAGQITALLGPNGGGKTTLFRTLLGLLPPLAGALLLDGLPLAQWPRRQLAQRMAYVPQGQTHVFTYTVLDTVLMGRAARLGPLAQPRRQDRDIAWQCLVQMGIAALAHRNQNEISGGERQLALIARALAQQPSLLIMDEPTASLDFGNQQRVLDQIQVLRNAGMAIVLSTHQPEHALLVADQIALLHQGRLIGPGPAQAIANAEELAQIYRVSPAQIRKRLGWLLG
ncbi:ABC transporter ATP-binding protein [Lampropedia puyangensis]|uniref:ABC transporter ATP-binding protein n=1 Tax=Lampropedia puyangensis TaxID=1330072 RepID=A0A4S8FB88_9BURK|nr:ABC transporter ATP-binding protein [Lampropedia puyangensis]THU04547.1 ABC transporter ATP-binding protein [Lampropedia puyangensis]